MEQFGYNLVYLIFKGLFGMLLRIPVNFKTNSTTIGKH